MASDGLQNGPLVVSKWTPFYFFMCCGCPLVCPRLGSFWLLLDMAAPYSLGFEWPVGIVPSIHYFKM